MTKFLTDCIIHPIIDNNSHAIEFMILLIEYLSYTFLKMATETPEFDIQGASIMFKKSYCFLYNERKAFGDRNVLSKHFNRFYNKGATFHYLFPYPECHHLEGNNFMMDRLTEWNNHIEKTYRKRYISNFVLQQTVMRIQCIIYLFRFEIIEKLIGYINCNYIHSENPFRWPVNYQEYTSSKTTNQPLESLWQWSDHITTHHILTVVFCLLYKHLCFITADFIWYIKTVHKERNFPYIIYQQQEYNEPSFKGFTIYYVHLIIIGIEMAQNSRDWGKVAIQGRKCRRDDRIDKTMSIGDFPIIPTDIS